MYRGDLTVDDGDIQTFAVIITFIKRNKNLLQRRAGAYQSSNKNNTLYLDKGLIKFSVMCFYIFLFGVSLLNCQALCLVYFAAIRYSFFLFLPLVGIFHMGFGKLNYASSEFRCHGNK